MRVCGSSGGPLCGAIVRCRRVAAAAVRRRLVCSGRGQGIMLAAEGSRRGARCSRARAPGSYSPLDSVARVVVARHVVARKRQSQRPCAHMRWQMGEPFEYMSSGLAPGWARGAVGSRALGSRGTRLLRGSARCSRLAQLVEERIHLYMAKQSSASQHWLGRGWRAGETVL